MQANVFRFRMYNKKIDSHSDVSIYTFVQLWYTAYAWVSVSAEADNTKFSTGRSQISEPKKRIVYHRSGVEKFKFCHIGVIVV